MYLKLMAFIAVITGIWIKIKKVYAKLAPLLDPFIKDVEERAKDGLIDRADRKAIAMALIANAQAQGKLRQFNFLERIVVSKVIDYVARKLPDFKMNPGK